MKYLISMAALAAASLAVASPAAAQRSDYRYGPSPEEQRFSAAQDRFERELQLFQAEFDRYRTWRNSNPGWRDGPPQRDPRYDDPRDYGDDRDEGDYDPSRYYRTGPTYQERVLRSDERVYRGRDGRYYCRRNDGTTGLIVGAATGGLFGNIIAGGHSRTAGTLLGAIAGAAIGSSIDRSQNEVRCR